MKYIIYCESTSKGMHSFYIKSADKAYYMFSQEYRKSVQYYYGKGVALSQSFSYGKSHGDKAITRTMDKLMTYIRYTEKEYELAVLEKTKKKKAAINGCRNSKRCA